MIALKPVIGVEKANIVSPALKGMQRPDTPGEVAGIPMRRRKYDMLTPPARNIRVRMTICDHDMCGLQVLPNHTLTGMP